MNAMRSNMLRLIRYLYPDRPLYWSEIASIYTIEDVDRTYNNEYIRLLNCLHQIRDDRR